MGLGSWADEHMIWPGQRANLCGAELNIVFEICFFVPGNKVEEKAYEIELYRIQTKYWESPFYSVKLYTLTS